jgi:hypothetical protein
MLLLSAVTLGLAYLSWRFVEQPFRARSFIGRRAIFAASGLGIVAFMSLGTAGHFGRDTITDVRLSSVDPTLRSTFLNKEDLLSGRDRLIRPFFASADAEFSGDADTKKILILGDSVAGDLYGSVMVNADRFDGMEIRRLYLDDQCMPDFERMLIDGELRSLRDRSCRPSLERLRDGPLFSMADVLVLSAHWARIGGDRPHLGVLSLAKTLAEQGRTVLIVGLLSLKDASSMAFKSISDGMTIEKANAYAYSTLKRGNIDQPNADVRALAEQIPNIRYLDNMPCFAMTADGLAPSTMTIPN